MSDAEERARRNAEIKRQRIQRERDALMFQVNGLDYERRELTAQFQKAGSVYHKKLLTINNQMQKLIDRQKNLLRLVDRLLMSDGKCSAFCEALLPTNADKAHTAHHCELDFGHEGKHVCACGTKFTEISTGHHTVCEVLYEHAPHGTCTGAGIGDH